MQCPTCIKLLPTVPRDLFINCEVPKVPWRRTIQISWIGIAKDIYSSWIISPTTPFYQMCFTSTIDVIGCPSELFSFEGILLIVFIYNGQCFNSKEWYSFKGKYIFKHSTSSQHYPQSSGFIKRHACTIKSNVPADYVSLGLIMSLHGELHHDGQGPASVNVGNHPGTRLAALLTGGGSFLHSMRYVVSFLPSLQSFRTATMLHHKN